MMWAFGVRFFSVLDLFLTSERHGGGHGVGLHRRFDDGGGGSREPCSCVVFFFFLLLYVMDDGRRRDTQE